MATRPQSSDRFYQAGKGHSEKLEPHYVFIHGANQSSDSFDFLRNEISPPSYTLIDYSSKNSFYDNLTTMKKKLRGKNNLFFVGHSLGGVYAVHLYSHFRKSTVAGVTLATPFGGSTAAIVMGLIPLANNQLMSDITPTSPPILESLAEKIEIPWVQLVSTRGYNPIHVVPNDGVVTYSSMMTRLDVEHLIVPEDHYSVVSSPLAADVIKNLTFSLA